MTDIKLAFLELGEKLLPVVIPLIQKIAGGIGNLADKFSNLTPFMQNTVLALGGVLMAAGPVLIIAGKLAMAIKYLGFEVNKAAMKLLAIKAAAVALVAVPLFLWWKSVSEAAADARERQDMLNESLIAAGDPTQTLVDRVTALNAEYREMNPVVEEAEKTIDDFVSKNVLMAELLDKKIATAFTDLGIDVKKLDAALATGTDTFEELEKQVKATGQSDKDLIEVLREQKGAVGDVTNVLAEQFEAQKITRDELGKMLDALDETADAWDDNRENLQANAEELINNQEQVGIWIEALGRSATSVLDAAGDTMTYQEALGKLETMMGHLNESQKQKIIDDM